MSERKMIALVPMVDQTSPSDWESRPRVKVLTGNETVSELLTWASVACRLDEARFEGPIHLYIEEAQPLAAQKGEG